MLVAEAPGWEEHKCGIPLVGKTGQELDERYLNGERLPARHAWFLSNLYREYKGKDYVYTAKDLRRDEPELLDELRRVQPKLIVTMGRHSTRYFLGDVGIEEVQGIPWILPATVNAANCFRIPPVIFPVTHIAAGFHNSEQSAYVVSGFNALAEYFTGKLEPRVLFDDPYPEPHYEEITTEAQLQSRLQGLSPEASLAIDTEGWPARPWSIQFSTEPGAGYLVRANRRDLIRQCSAYLDRVRPTLVYHSALHDLGMMRALELPTDMPFDDTMVMAYLLQIEPQGLKPLCARHCNMQMQNYTELTSGPAHRLALDYIQALWDVEQLDYEEECQDAFWQEIDKGRRISVFPKLPKSSLHRATERMLRSKDPRKLWNNQVEDIQVEGYRRLGSMPLPTLDYVPAAVAIRYGCRDSDGTGRLLPQLSRRIDVLGLREVYDLELSTYPLIERMSHVGIKPDLPHFTRLSHTLETELQTLQHTLAHETSDTSFNANSGDQVARYLFDQLGIDPIGRQLKSERFSTNDKILEALEHEHPEHPVIGTIRTYREVYKLKHTFVDRVPDFVHRWPFDGRVHATFRTTRVVTGRLASSDPNMLAQPEHGKFAEDFKRGWIAEPGHVLCAWDESQIELRGLAHLSQDPVLLSAFRAGQDLHAKLAARIFGGQESVYLGKCYERFAVKEINFGIPMGMGPKGLMVALRGKGIEADEETAQRWLDETLGLYRGVKRYMDERKAEARRQGFVRCLSGRIRYIGGIRSPHAHIRQEAERFAFSTPIQESATWIMKQAEATIYQDILVPFWRQNIWVEPLLQVHDSIKIEVVEGLQDELHVLMSQAMTQVPKGFSVPLAVAGEWGTSFGEMETFS
jgi:uracil-DNA glycosylase family 4